VNGADGDLLDLLGDSVIVVDRDQRIVAANLAAARLTGFAPDGLVGQACADALNPHDGRGRPLWIDGWPRHAALRSVKALAEQTIVLSRRDSSQVRVTVTGTYQRDADGSVAGAVVMLRRQARPPNSATSGIEMVAAMSHELRAPLASIKGYTALLIHRGDRLSDDDKRVLLEHVHHDADRVTRLITELLDAGRLESGQLVLRRQLVDVPRLIGDVLEKVRLEYPALEAETAFPAEFPEVYADPDKLDQVLTNLVENACKYGSPRGLVIEGTRDRTRASVAVIDCGAGIPPADLSKVFTKFFRRDEGDPSGSGLGLWISRALVEAHGGKLVAESNRASGATFRFTLPIIDLDKLQSS
jgi:PAS domain S-box-containing protein